MLQKFDTKTVFEGGINYVLYSGYESLRRENEKLQAKLSETVIHLAARNSEIAELKAKLDALMQNSESQTQTQRALIKKLDKAKDALDFYASQFHTTSEGYGHEEYTCYDDIYVENGLRARTTLEEIGK